MDVLQPVAKRPRYQIGARTEVIDHPRSRGTGSGQSPSTLTEVQRAVRRIWGDEYANTVEPVQAEVGVYLVAFPEHAELAIEMDRYYECEILIEADGDDEHRVQINAEMP